MDALAMKFSVVIPTLFSPELDRTLRSVLAQTYSPESYEIIVVGLDQSASLLQHERVQFDQTERPFSPAAARNRGARQAAAEIVVFLDSDCVANPDWLSILERAFADLKVEAVGGGVRFETKNYWTMADNISMFHEFLAGQPAGQRAFLPSLNFAIRKNVFLAAGGFVE
jgi:glycosyltransferase involved in cell wall biosynthesis